MRRLQQFSATGFKTIFVHSICWLIFIGFELVLGYVIVKHQFNFIATLRYYPVNIILFYLQYFIIHRYYDIDRKSIFFVLFLVIINLLLSLLIKGIIDYLFASEVSHLEGRLQIVKEYIGVNFYRSVYFSIYSGFYWLTKHAAEDKARRLATEKRALLTERESQKLELLLKRTENAYLQQQLNPHMLFNALNFVYNAVYKHSETGAVCIQKLSEVLRYGLDHNDISELGVLQDEVEQVRNLISINRLRFGDTFYLHFQLTGSMDNKTIIPLSLVTLTENVFKHGDLTTENQPALISIETSLKNIHFKTFNLKKTVTLKEKEKFLGLRNLISRLDYEYGNRYSLTVNETENFFEIDLNIQS